MQIKRILPLALVLLSFGCSSEAYSQTRRRPNSTSTSIQKRRVILDLVTQEPIGADFIQADATSITVEINGVRRVFRIDEVVSVIFSPDEADRRLSQRANAQGTASVREALRALRRLNSAVDVGVSFVQYSQLLVEVKGIVDEALASIPTGELRNEITLAMQAYGDAGQAWSAMISGDYLTRLNVRRMLAERYQVPENIVRGVSSSSISQTQISMILGYVFINARAHLDRASSLNQ